MTTQYRTKPIASLTDRELALAETDIGNCLLRSYAAPDDETYNAYFASLSEQALAVRAEVERRAGA